MEDSKKGGFGVGGGVVGGEEGGGVGGGWGVRGYITS